MAKAYWVSAYRTITNPDAVAAYAKLAGPAILAAGGKFLARGNAAVAYEAGVKERIVGAIIHQKAQQIAGDLRAKAKIEYIDPNMQTPLDLPGQKK